MKIDTIDKRTYNFWKRWEKSSHAERIGIFEKILSNFNESNVRILSILMTDYIEDYAWYMKMKKEMEES